MTNQRTGTSSPTFRAGRRWAGISACVLAAALAAIGSAAEPPSSAPAAAGPVATVQTECPVMIGNKIDPDIFTVYRGKKVYFCCLPCKSAFEKDPAKYLPRLPQFAAAQGQAHVEVRAGGEVEHAPGGSAAGRLIEPMGMVTLSLVAATVCLGVLRRVRGLGPRRMLGLHKVCGVLALLAGAVHAILVGLAH